jgi:acyl-CoA thioester hydrolase
MAAVEDNLPFRYFLRVRYSECDAQKVVFNARYGDYVDLAVTEFMRALGFGAEVADGRLDYQLVRQTLEWKASAHFDDIVEAQVTSKRLGNTSFTLGIEFRRVGFDAVISTAETVYVMVDSGLRKTPLTSLFRESLERGAPGVVSDHAGYFINNAFP